ncbi:class I SAM-dependent methyltransferase [Nocardia sp. NBC_00511]|uniref:class I SAM-dependent methyltransferase n=1 Tax=Nocardia sp. NBC_00511 TaxID=2903591 RepID=UPI0030DF9FCC
MVDQRGSTRHGSYGVDAPPVVMGLASAMVVCIAGIVVSAFSGIDWLAGLFTLGAVWSVGQLGLYLHATRRGKFAVWNELLDELALRGDERVLDLGCGRGAVLLAAARRLPTGEAVGIDLWRSVDQSGNAEEVTRRNAEAEGVSDRVELLTGDITALPFPDNSFDVVVSSLVIHNIGVPDARIAAVTEALRVLKPGGRLRIADIQHTDEYETRVVELKATDVALRPLGWRMWWGGPWMPTRLVTATKAAER